MMKSTAKLTFGKNENMEFSKELQPKFKFFHFHILEVLIYFRKLNFLNKIEFGITNETKKDHNKDHHRA